MHSDPHPKSGQTVKIHLRAEHAQLEGLDHEYEVEDWWDKLTGKSWGMSEGNPTAMIYGMRIGFAHAFDMSDDEVVYGHIGQFGHLIHQSEIVESTPTGVREW